MSAVSKIFYDEKNKQKEKIQIGMIIDDYKLINKEIWWAKSIEALPGNQMDKYEFVKEIASPGLTDDTTALIRHFKLKKS